MEAPASSGLAELDVLRVLGLDPANALQHLGFYYYMAAQATERRHTRFLAFLKNLEVNSANLPGFANEKGWITSQLCARCVISGIYLHDPERGAERSCTPKRMNFSRSTHRRPMDTGRLTLRVAGQIAGTYYASGKFDMAVRFFERIAKTYRRERWCSTQLPLFVTWHKCAQTLGDVELSVKILVEMLANGMHLLLRA